MAPYTAGSMPASTHDTPLVSMQALLVRPDVDVAKSVLGTPSSSLPPKPQLYSTGTTTATVAPFLLPQSDLNAAKVANARYELRSQYAPADPIKVQDMDEDQLREEVAFWRALAEGPAGVGEVAQTFQSLQSTVQEHKTTILGAEAKCEEYRGTLAEQQSEMETKSRELELLHDENRRLRKDLIVEKRRTDPHNMTSSAIAPEQAVASRTRTKVSRKVEDLISINDPLLDAEEQLRPKKKPKIRNYVLPKSEKYVYPDYLRGKCGRTPSNCKHAHPTGENFKNCVLELSSKVDSEVRITVKVDDENAKGVCREHMLSRCGKRSEKCKFAHPAGQAFVLMKAMYEDE